MSGLFDGSHGFSQILFKLLKMAFVLPFLLISPLEAAYITVYTGTDNGALSWTGNTLGLNKASGANQPGTGGSIGAFTTLNTSLKVGNYPAGTTLDWAQNSSSAVLDIPEESTILYAELIWGGTYGYGSSVSNTNMTSISFITPDSVSHTITPRADTAQSYASFSSLTGEGGYYVRSAEVTSLVTGSGTYTVGGVPASVTAAENGGNCAGWTLAVAYQNPNMFTSNLTIFVAAEFSGQPPAVVSGFYAPNVGTISSRLFVSAFEGDVRLTGDRLLVGNTSTLTTANAVSGTNNPINNFFASQINTLLTLTTDVSTGKLVASGSSELDQRGTFGTSNSDAGSGTNVSGARQGYDITSIDLGSLITNGQTQLYVQGVTSSDGYLINALGIQIQVAAPVIQANKQASQATVILNDIVTYTVTLKNVGGSTASSLVFNDVLPAGLTFIQDTFTINGSPFSTLTTQNIPLGDLTVDQTITIQFQARVTQISPSTSYPNSAKVDYAFITQQNQDPLSLSAQTNIVTITPSSITPPVANDLTETTTANVPLSSTSVLIHDTGTNIEVQTYQNITTQGGAVVMTPDGVYTYTPPINFSGIDTFTYIIHDAIGQTATATITIIVLPLAYSDTANIPANTSLIQNISVLDNDIGTGLSITTFQNPSNQGGLVAMNADGTYTYTPPKDFSGTDGFNYTTTDSASHTTTAIVNITVLPVAANDVGETYANTVLNGSTVFTNDAGQGLTLIAYDQNSANGGTILLNTQDGTYVYTPPLNFSGIDSFTYTVMDQAGKTSTATVTITVRPIAVDDTGSTTVNQPLNQSVSVLNNAVGVGLSIHAYDQSSIQNGTVQMQSNGTYLYTPPPNFSGIDSFTYSIIDSAGNTNTAKVVMTIKALLVNDNFINKANATLIGSSVLSNDTSLTLKVIDFQTPSNQGGAIAMNTDGTFTYQPPLNFSGVDFFTYSATDSSELIYSATVTINVLPLAIGDTVQAIQNTKLIGPSVLTNDIGTDLKVIAFQNPSSQGGAVSMDSDGTYRYDPPPYFTGKDSFTYTIADATGNSAQATITILVTPLIIFPPKNFQGVIEKYKFLNKTHYRLNAHWDPSESSEVAWYRIYHKGKIMAQIPVGSPREFTKCSKSKCHAKEYFITAVHVSGIESVPIRLRIQNG